MPAGKRRGPGAAEPRARRFCYSRRPMLYRAVIPASLVLLGTLAGCKDATTRHRAERRAIEELPVSTHWDMPALRKPAHVVFVEGRIPHVYAADEHDAWMITGFMHARDRYVQMELTRRFGEGRLTELVGEAALATDQETRGRGGNEITDRLLAQLSPEEGALLDAYAEGINFYIRTMKADPLNQTLRAPTELPLVALALGDVEWYDLMEEMDRRDVVAMLTAVLFNSSFTSDDLNRQQVLDTIPDLFTTAPNAALREAGLRDDIFDWVRPVHLVPSANGFGLEQMASLEERLEHRTERPERVQRDVLARALASAQRFDTRRRGPPGSDYGSNAWALGARGTPNGTALLAGDGHLPLSVPALLYQMGTDTTIYGGRDGQHLLGLWFPGIPMMALGTNGNVAFSFTYLYGDLVDWYAEQITLDASGAPASSLFDGQQRPMTATTDSYVVANVPSLGSVGRTETWNRYRTFDGRMLVAIEGVLVSDGGVAGPGETVVSMLGEPIVPRDVDMNGRIDGISFDYTGLDVSNLVRALRDADRARTVEEFGRAQRSFVGFAQNFVAADRTGSVYYNGYTGTPCRSHLERVGTGDDTRFAPGADPRLLLDGTRYGGFTVPVDADNRVDEAIGLTDPSRCVVPYDRWPHAIDPASGYTLTANNDLGGLSFDGSLANDEYYLGGPWAPGYRARTIATSLAADVSAQSGSVASMAAIQADHTSHVGREFVPYLLDAISEARALSTPATPEETRVRQLYLTHQAPIDEAITRLEEWLDRGADAASGVETFYDTPSADGRLDAVATMIFNAYFRELNANVFDDEGIDAVLALDSRFMRSTSLRRFLDGRGPGNPQALASYDAATGESVFFDDTTTPEVESSREVLVASLVDALDGLAGPTTAPGQGGFGTSDQTAWLWGLRHQVALESLITAYAGNIMGIELVALATRISTKQLPLVPALAQDDPRYGLTWFPRPGDWFSVDAANPPISGPDYVYRNGPVMRMVIELGPEGFVRGQNVIPAGQSGIVAFPTYKDQAALWLGNQTYPMRWTVEDVVAHAIDHETFE